MTQRRRVSSNSPYEAIIGFSRAVRVGDSVYVSGTVAWGEDGELVGPGDVYLQAQQTIRNIENALVEAGTSLRDVVRTRIYLTDISRWEEAARAHAEAFAQVRPAASMVQVAALADPAMLVEIEAVAESESESAGAQPVGSLRRHMRAGLRQRGAYNMTEDRDDCPQAEEPTTALESRRWAHPETPRDVKKAATLVAYVQTATIRGACKVSGVGEATHYEWMKTDPGYAEAFAEAKVLTLDRLKEEAVRRAVEGVEEPVFYQGKPSGTIRRYSDTLLIFLMKAADPKTYRDNYVVEHTGADGGPLALAVVPLPPGSLSDKAEIVDGRVVRLKSEGERPAPPGPVRP